MLNIIKMDLYRMLKTKSMYVIWIVLAAILLITTSLSKTDYELLTEKDAMKQEQVTELTSLNISLEEYLAMSHLSLRRQSVA